MHQSSPFAQLPVLTLAAIVFREWNVFTGSTGVCAACGCLRAWLCMYLCCCVVRKLVHSCGRRDQTDTRWRPLGWRVLAHGYVRSCVCLCARADKIVIWDRHTHTHDFWKWLHGCDYEVIIMMDLAAQWGGKLSPGDTFPQRKSVFILGASDTSDMPSAQ